MQAEGKRVENFTELIDSKMGMLLHKPFCKQSCYGAFLKSRRLHSGELVFQRKKLQDSCYSLNRQLCDSIKAETDYVFFLLTFRTSEEIRDLKDWSLNCEQYRKYWKL